MVGASDGSPARTAPRPAFSPSPGSSARLIPKTQAPRAVPCSSSRRNGNHRRRSKESTRPAAVRSRSRPAGSWCLRRRRPRAHHPSARPVPSRSALDPPVVREVAPADPLSVGPNQDPGSSRDEERFSQERVISHPIDLHHRGGKPASGVIRRSPELPSEADLTAMPQTSGSQGGTAFHESTAWLASVAAVSK